MKKICVVTGSRAEYGLLSNLMRMIKEEAEFTLQVIATNMHLSPEFGNTYIEIERDGFTIDRRLEMLLSSDTANGTTKSVGLAFIGFADAYEELKPDLILVLGDRYEILAAVSSALFYKIPVGHLHGGEITEGSYDDSMRHAITKMSHLHFTSTEEYRDRVIQLGEDPDTVFNVGALGIDNILHMKLLSKQELEDSINFKIGEKCVLVTFHPTTLEHHSSEKQIQNLLEVLKDLESLRIIFTLPNSDADSHIIIEKINEFVKANKDRSIAFASLGQVRYLSALQYVEAVIGNSSSGIIEVPSFNVPSLNIGNRQRGRLKASTVVNCEPIYEDIKEKLSLILSPPFKAGIISNENPYQKKNTAFEILSILKQTNFELLIQKRFYNRKA